MASVSDLREIIAQTVNAVKSDLQFGLAEIHSQVVVFSSDFHFKSCLQISNVAAEASNVQALLSAVSADAVAIKADLAQSSTSIQDIGRQAQTIAFQFKG